jgi:hypothetical protein
MRLMHTILPMKDSPRRRGGTERRAPYHLPSPQRVPLCLRGESHRGLRPKSHRR